MPKRGKKYKETITLFERQNLYDLDQGIEILKKTARAKFNETAEIHIKLGIDPRRSDQNVRGTVVLPHGTGKTPRVIVFAKGDKIKEALEAGADSAGAEDLVEKVKGGWMDWDIAAATPDMMGLVGKALGRTLGPKMPSPKSGTLSLDIGGLVRELKAGKVQFRTDKLGIIHCPVGKVNFEADKLKQNMKVLLDSIIRAKPSTAKGAYLKSLVLASTMGPGIKIDPQKASQSAKEK